MPGSYRGPRPPEASAFGQGKTTKMVVPAVPTEILLDPDYRLVVARPGPRVNPKEAISKIIKEVVNNPTPRGAKLMRRTIGQLEMLVADAPRNYDGLCYTGIGRCRFRLGEFEAARAAFKKALTLGAGGSFHRAWIYLRLGNMADVEKKRREAVRNYELSAKQGDYFQSRQAKKFIRTAYVPK